MEAKEEVKEAEVKVLSRYEAVKMEIETFLSSDTAEFSITNEAQYANSSVLLESIKKVKSEIIADKEKVCKPLHEAWKTELANFTPKIEYLEDNVEVIESAGRKFRKQVADDDAELQRIADLKNDQLQIKAEGKAENAEKTAEEYSEQGREDKAAEWVSKAEGIRAEASSTVSQIFKTELPKSRGGFNTKRKFKGRIKNVAELLESYKQNGVPQKVMDAMQKHVDAQAQAAYGTKSTVPGTEYYEVF